MIYIPPHCCKLYSGQLETTRYPIPVLIWEDHKNSLTRAPLLNHKAQFKIQPRAFPFKRFYGLCRISEIYYQSIKFGKMSTQLAGGAKCYLCCKPPREWGFSTMGRYISRNSNNQHKLHGAGDATDRNFL